MPLNFEEHKELAKQDVLFIHGNLASSAWWQPTLAEWKKQGPLGRGALIFADWRGCGQNPDWPMDSTFTIKDLAEDFLSMLRGQGRHQIAVVGHSLGGLIALEMMIRDPMRITRATLLDPVGPQGVVFDDSMYEAFRQMGLNRELTKTVILSTIANADQLPNEFVEQITNDAFKAVKGIGSSVLQILKTVNLVEPARNVRTPTLVMHGELDQIIPLKDSEQLAKLLPNSKLEILPGAGHCWNVENPGAFVKRLRDWL